MTTGKWEQKEISLMKDKAVFKPLDPLSGSDVGGNFLPVQCRGYSDRIKNKQKVHKIYVR
jgi:hypothetical protein